MTESDNNREPEKELSERKKTLNKKSSFSFINAIKGVFFTLIAALMIISAAIFLVDKGVIGSSEKGTIQAKLAGVESNIAAIIKQPKDNSLKGPFGINWGVSVDELKSAGIELKLIQSDGRLSLYGTRTLPETLPISSEYVLVFDKDYKLQSITMLSKQINDDFSGVEGKKVYSSIKNILQKKYGPATSEFESDYTVLNAELFAGGMTQDFYTCLKKDGSCQWTSYFEYKLINIHAGIELFQETKGKARVLLHYDGPKWESIRQSMISEKDDADNLYYSSASLGNPRKYFAFYGNDKNASTLDGQKELNDTPYSRAYTTLLTTANDALKDFDEASKSNDVGKKMDNSLFLSAVAAGVDHACKNDALASNLNTSWNNYAQSNLLDSEHIRKRISDLKNISVSLINIAESANLAMPNDECSKWFNISNILIEAFTSEAKDYQENSESDPILQRCKRMMGEHGWAMIKACVDQDLEAKKALERYN